jgi:hypothetical protein
MLGSVVLDLAIGMAFIYLLLSLIASVLQEMLASFVQARSAILQRGLHSLFSGDAVDAEKSLVERIYDHGLIRGLYQDPRKDYAAENQQAGVLAQQNHPGNPPPQEKSYQLSRWTRFRLWVQGIIGISPISQIKSASDPMLLPAYIPPRTFALALIDILNKDKANGQPLQNIRKLLVDVLNSNPENKAAQALMALATDAKGDLDKFQKNLENWFNDSMDRVSGWYKKHTQELLFVIGLAIAVFLNVNSVRVAETLWVDRDARQGMVNAATSYIQHNPAPPVTQTPDSSQPNNSLGLVKSMQSSVQAFHDVANQSLLPVGWRRSPRWYWNTVRANPPAATMRGLITLVGWLITAAALSLGAPFWFDTLSKIMTVRSSIKPQDDTQTADSKDA